MPTKKRTVTQKALEEKDLKYLDDKQAVTVDDALMPIINGFFQADAGNALIPTEEDTNAETDSDEAQDGTKKDNAAPAGLDLQESDITSESGLTVINEIVTAFSGMTLRSIRLLCFCLAHYRLFQGASKKGDEAKKGGEAHMKQREDTKPTPINQLPMGFKATVSQLADIFPNMNESNAYRDISETISAINDHPFTFVARLPDGRPAKISIYWFEYLVYIEKEGEFYFGLAPKIAAFSRSRAGRFTFAFLRDFARCGSVMGARLFFLLKRVQNYANGIWHVSVDDFKNHMGVQGKYARWGDLKYTVLDPAVKEINEKTSLNVEYVTGRRGRFIAELIFKITPKELAPTEDPKVVSTVGDLSRDFMLLREQGLSASQATKIAAAAADKGVDLEYMLPRLIEQYNNKPKRGRGTKAGYLMAALEGELGPNLFDKLPPDTPPVIVKADLKVGHGKLPPQEPNQVETLRPADPKTTGESLGNISTLIGIIATDKE